MRVLLLAAALLLQFAAAVPPNVNVKVASPSAKVSLQAAYATFGARVRGKRQQFQLKVPQKDKQLCGKQQEKVWTGDVYLLVERGNCSFAEKALAAQQLGAQGVIVYNSVNALYNEDGDLPKVSSGFLAGYVRLAEIRFHKIT